jgi:hypothetical protein
MPRRLLGILTGALVLAWPAAAAAAEVTVRVEGSSSTVVPLTRVATPSGPVVRAGHACAGATPLGALDVATHGDWGGEWSDSLGWSVTRVRGETHLFTSPTYWALWRNYALAQTGVCDFGGPTAPVTPLADGDEVLLTACTALPPAFDCPDPLELVAPVSGRTRRPLRVRVLDHADSGAVTPAAGALVLGRGRAWTTDAQGYARPSFRAPGTVRLLAVKHGAVRSAATPVCLAAARDGTCGTADRTPPVPRLLGLRQGQVLRRGPRLLRGKVAADHSGLRRVLLGLIRRSAGRCYSYSARRELLVRVRCRGQRLRYFSLGARSRWSYLLPFRLPPGRYVVATVAVDRAGNRSRPRSGVSRIAFTVGSRR